MVELSNRTQLATGIVGHTCRVSHLRSAQRTSASPSYVVAVGADKGISAHHNISAVEREQPVAEHDQRQS